jgi:hypothetical protein
MAATTTLMLTDLLRGDVRARLTELLSPEATVVIVCQEADRLPTTLLAAALTVMASSQGYLRFEGLSTLAQVAISLIDVNRRLAVTTPARAAQPVGDRPFQVSIAENGQMTIVLVKNIGQHPYMNETWSHEWVRALEVPKVSIDLSQVEHLNSSLVAWMLQVNQGVGAGRCELKNVGRQAVAQLTQLRLNHLLSIV